MMIETIKDILKFIESECQQWLYETASLVRNYFKYRPRYNPEMFKTIAKFYEEGKGPECNYNLAVDVGCGSGQSTLPLSKYFTRVLGCDVSPAQLSQAPTDNDGVEFLMCVSENLDFLKDNSVDLLTAGTAMHWFDQEKFSVEAGRVLKPGGVLAVFAYDYGTIEEVEGQNIYSEHRRLLLNYDVIDYAKVGDMYERYMFELPFAKWKSLRMTNNDALDIKMQRSVPDFLGFLQSDHAWQMYLDANPHTDHIARIEDRLRDAFKDSTGNETSLMNITWRVLLLMGRKPIE